MNSELSDFLRQYGSLSDQESDLVTSYFKSKPVAKGEVLLTPGQTCNKLFFVRTGCLRLYHIADHVEITVWFSFENSSAIELSSFLSGSPSEYFIEAIEDSEVLLLHKSDLLRLYETVPSMQALMRAFWEDVIQNLLRRFTALQKDTAEKRYVDLLKQPAYMQRIPQKYLASYIGVTPTSLSRIRRRVR